MKEAILNSTFFGVLLCLVAFEIGLIAKKRFKMAIFNPLLIANIIVILTLFFLNIPYEKFNASAQHISFFLTPLTVCLAVPLYEQLNLLKNNSLAITIGISAGVFAGLISIYLLSLIFHLDHQFYVTMLPKSVTAPIGIGISDQHGGIVTITIAAIMLTGIIGNVFGDILLRIFRIKKSVAKGIALGCAAHAMGTAKAIELGDVEGAMASLAMAITGLMSVIGANIFINFI